MFFRVRDLEVRKIFFDVSFAPGEIEFEPGLQQVGPLHTEGVAELLSNTLGEIRVRGTAQVRMKSVCDRCLEPLEFPLDRSFDLFYRPVDTAPTSEEAAIDEGESEIGFYDGDGLELKEVLREQILLWLPMQMVCSEDCKGICPDCGQNRNQTACGCQPKPVDDRWEALKALKPRTS